MEVDRISPRRRKAGLYRNLGWNMLEDNPYPRKKRKKWVKHHLNDVYLIKVPSDIHWLYSLSINNSGDRESHRENMIYILKQIYGDRIYWKE